MKHVLSLIAILFLAPAPSFIHKASPLRLSELPCTKGALVGTWRLVSRLEQSADGATRVDPGLGADPIGYLIYDAKGHMAVQLMKRDRSSQSATNPLPAANRDNNSGAVFGYDAYFGTYTVDEVKGEVTHHLEGALVPSDVGKSLTREFRVAGDRLTIRVQTIATDGTNVTRTLLWERAA